MIRMIRMIRKLLLRVWRHLLFGLIAIMVSLLTKYRLIHGKQPARALLIGRQTENGLRILTKVLRRVAENGLIEALLLLLLLWRAGRVHLLLGFPALDSLSLPTRSLDLHRQLVLTPHSA
jgi:hypothetical protein